MSTVLHPDILAQYTVASDTPLTIAPPELVGEPLPGARILRVRWHTDVRGGLMEIHRESWWGDSVVADAAMERLARASARQVYLSATMPGTVKGWHLHCAPDGDTDRWGEQPPQTDRFVAVRGRALLVLVDLRGYQPADRPYRRASPVDAAFLRELGLGVAEVLLDADRAPLRVEVPPGVAHGWIALGNEECIIANCVSREYDGTQERRCDPHGFIAVGLPAYAWRGQRDG